jgi:ABC-type transport system involved in multi-copper enzyme maturation permease subunit
MESMMLWYKAWQESRTRFVVIAATLTGFCLFAVLFHTQSGAYSARIQHLIYKGTAKGMFAMLVIFLGLSGLLRERRRRTAVFTLALPVGRLRIVVTQMAVGLLELAALSLLPALLIPSLSLLVHQHFPFAEALHFSILWIGCCSVIFAAAFLLSVVLDGEYTAPVACYVALMLEVLISNWPSLRPYRLNLMWTMSDWDPQHNLLPGGPLPWARLLTIMLIALGMLALAARITQKQDF